MPNAGFVQRVPKVVSENWAYAYYLKAYSLLELGRISEAKETLARALELSPRNSQFLSEFGHIYQLEKNWPKALEMFQASEAAAREFSPPELKATEHSRALRGLGYVHIELGQLDEAEKIYQQCLEIDKTDERAAHQLQYISNLRAKQSRQVVNTGSDEQNKSENQQKRFDVISYSDAAHATFFAALRCRQSSDPRLDITNLEHIFGAAAKEVARRNPGMQSQEVVKEMSERIAKVKAAVNRNIDSLGCEEPSIRRLIDNYRLISKRPDKPQ